MTNRARLTGAGLLLLTMAIASNASVLAEDIELSGAPALTPEAYYFAQDAGRVGVATAGEDSSAPTPSEAEKPQPASKARLGLDTLGECLDRNGPCGEPGDYWFRGEYLHWWTKGSRVPALVSTGDLADPIGTMQTLFGDSTVNGRDHEGFRLNLGMWLDGCHTWGLEGDYFDLGRRANDYDSGLSNGYPVLMRPFYLPDGTLVAESVAFPNGPAALAGRVTVDTDDYFRSAGIWLRRNWYCTECCTPTDCDKSVATKWGNNGGVRSTRVDAIIGYRNFRLNDRVAVHESLTNIGGGGSNGDMFDVQDSFRANNDFNGIDLGLNTMWYRDRWSLGLNAKVALGAVHESVDIWGQTISTSNTGVVDVYQGGLLAQTNSNMGLHSRNRFAAIPQLGAELGFQMNTCTKFIVGYDILYWDKVLRAGEQIDPIVDPGNIPPPPATGGPHPEFKYREACYWAQGIRLGMEFRY